MTTRAPFLRSAAVSDSKTRIPPTEGGSVGTSKTGGRSLVSSSSPTLWAWGNPRAAREACAADVPFVTELRCELERPRGDRGARQLGARKVLGEVGGMEVLEPSEPHEDETAAA